MLSGPLRLLGIAAAIVFAGCAPTLQRYVEKMDPESASYRKAVPAPLASSTPSIQKTLTVARFTDDRTFADRVHVGDGIMDTIAGVLSLGVAVAMDAGHPDQRNQPISGLETGLPQQITSYLASARTFSYCVFENRLARYLLEGSSSRAASVTTDLVLTGSVKAFSGAWTALDPQSTVGEDAGATKLGSSRVHECRGRIEVELTLTDVRSRAQFWTGTVEVTEELDALSRDLESSTACALSNRLAVLSLGSFLVAIDGTLRGLLASAADDGKPK